MRTTTNQILGTLEKDIMDLVWNASNPVTVREIFEQLGKKRKIAYTTVMTIMGRLVKKGFLKTSGEGKAYTYKAAISKDKFLTEASRQIIKNLVSSFGDVAIAHFTEELEKIPVARRKSLTRILKNSKDEN